MGLQLFEWSEYYKGENNINVNEIKYAKKCTKLSNAQYR